MMLSTAACVLAATSVLAIPVPESKSLTIGDPAPPLKVARWIRGKPVAGFAKDRITVVHFWATWFSPSTNLGHDGDRGGVPPGPGDDRNPMQQMAAKYEGKVAFLSVNVDAYDNRSSGYPAERAKAEPESVLLSTLRRWRPGTMRRSRRRWRAGRYRWSSWAASMTCPPVCGGLAAGRQSTFG
jgi:hypothetical protein